MSMQSRCLLIVCLSGLWFLPSGFGCKIEGNQICHYHEVVQEKSYYNLLLPNVNDDFQLTCDQQKVFLECGLQEIFKKDCKYTDLVELYAVRSLYDAICLNIQAYKRSRPCMVQLKEPAEECIRDFRREVGRKEHRCLKVQRTRGCIDNVVSNGTYHQGKCSYEDKMFLERVTGKMLINYAHSEMYNCDMAMFADLDVTKTTTTTTTQTTTTTTTQTTTTTPETKTLKTSLKSELVTPHSESSPKVGQLLSGDVNSSCQLTPAAAFLFIAVVTVF